MQLSRLFRGDESFGIRRLARRSTSEGCALRPPSARLRERDRRVRGWYPKVAGQTRCLQMWSGRLTLPPPDETCHNVKDPRNQGALVGQRPAGADARDPTNWSQPDAVTSASVLPFEIIALEHGLYIGNESSLATAGWAAGADLPALHHRDGQPRAAPAGPAPIPDPARRLPRPLTAARRRSVRRPRRWNTPPGGSR
jgi:hypothetical protein